MKRTKDSPNRKSWEERSEHRNGCMLEGSHPIPWVAGRGAALLDARRIPPGGVMTDRK